MPRKIDYTKMRMNKLVSDGRRIGVCPKCGRKGAVIECEPSRIKNTVAQFYKLVIVDHVVEATGKGENCLPYVEIEGAELDAARQVHRADLVRRLEGAHKQLADFDLAVSTDA